jgi:hypothetical protein
MPIVIDTYFRIKPPLAPINYDHLYDSHHNHGRASKANRSEKLIAIQSFLDKKELEGVDDTNDPMEPHLVAKKDQPSSKRDNVQSINELAMDIELNKKIEKLQKSDKEIKDPSLKTEEVNYGLLVFPEAAIKENLDIVMPRSRVPGKPIRNMIKPTSLPRIKCTIETKKPFQVMQGSTRAEMLKKLSGSKSFWGEVPNLPNDSLFNSRSKLLHPRATQIAQENPRERVWAKKEGQVVIEESKLRPAPNAFPYSRYGEKKKIFEERNKDYLNRDFNKLETKITETTDIRRQRTVAKALPKLQLKGTTNKERGTIKLNTKADVDNVARLLAQEGSHWYLPPVSRTKSLKVMRPTVATVDRFNVQYVFGSHNN